MSIRKHLNPVRQRILFLAPAVQTGTSKEGCLSQYQVLGGLGQGLMGKVALVKQSATGRTMALKSIDKQKIRLYKCQEQMRREVKIMYKTKHKHIARLLTHFEEDTGGRQLIFLAMEKASDGTVRDLLIKRGSLTLAETRSLFYQLALAVSYLHKHQVTHRDIKPQNLLLDGGTLKLSDFGASNFDDHKLTTFCGTLNYLAVEMVEGQGYHRSVDLWSMGIVLYQLLTGRPPFQAPSKDTPEQNYFKSVVANIRSGKMQFPEGFPQEPRQILRNLLTRHQNRKDIQWVLEHPWLREEVDRRKLPDLPRQLCEFSPEQLAQLQSQEGGNPADQQQLARLRDEVSNLTSQLKIAYKRLKKG